MQDNGGGEQAGEGALDLEQHQNRVHPDFAAMSSSALPLVSAVLVKSDAMP